MVVDYELDQSVARIFLNRPHRLNAVVPELTDALVAALGRAEADAARAVVLAGRGRAFCSGHDLKEPVPPETVLQTRRRVDGIQEVTRAIRRFPGPVIAAVHGYALGAGCEFALGCDLVVAAEDAQFGFPEVSVGLSVTGGISRLLPLLVGTGCLGRPVGYKKVQITDAGGRPVAAGQTGEIVLAGAGIMDGYFGDPEATARVMRDGWFRTGDLGRMDARGRVYYAGRLKDMIRRSGENVAAREVEEVLLTHPGIRLAAVTAVPDELRGEEIKAYYVTSGDAAIGAAELAQYTRERLAAFKVPRFWQAASDLPRTDSERVIKAGLGALAGPVFDAVAGTWAGNQDGGTAAGVHEHPPVRENF
jgi:acyl-CoA synthetase (AMP-forming)/AMP-acid ligase II